MQVYSEHEWSRLSCDGSDATPVVRSERRMPSRNTSGHHGSGDPSFRVGRHGSNGAPQESAVERWNPPWPGGGAGNLPLQLSAVLRYPASGQQQHSRSLPPSPWSQAHTLALQPLRRSPEAGTATPGVHQGVLQEPRRIPCSRDAGASLERPGKDACQAAARWFWKVY